MNFDDLDTMVVDADPALSVAIPSGSSAEARWHYVQVTTHLAGRGHHRRRLILTAGIVAPIAAALVLLTVIVIPGPSGPKSAAAVVLEAASATAGQQNTQAAPGQYLYTETQSAYQVTLYDAKGTPGEMVKVATAQFNETDQAWTNAGGTGSALQTDGGVRFPSAADQAAWNASPSGPSVLQRIAQFGENGGQARPEQPVLNVSDLPTDPNVLASVIATGGLHTNVDLISAGPNATFERTATLLLGPTVGMTPALASALFQVLADQPGVQLLGTVTDHNGQQGQGIVLATADGTNVSEVVVDPKTGSLLEAQFALPAPMDHNASGISQAVLAPVWTDVVATGVVNSKTATLPPTGNAPTTATLVPGSPTGLTATSKNGEIQLSWTAPTNDGFSPIMDYVVYEYAGKSTTSGPAALFDTHSTATNYTWNDQTGAPCTFTVQAVNASGYGLASSSVTAVP